MAATTTLAATTTTAPLPTTEQMMAVLLIPAEVGAGFVGRPPVVGEDADYVASRPICDVRREDSKKSLVTVSVGPIVSSPEPKEQVYERLSVESDPNELLDLYRRRGEARCQFQEAVGSRSYTVKVDGPIDLGGIGDAAAGFSQTYSSGYDGFRWEMFARRGRIGVNVQYTSTSPIDPARAKSLLVTALDKASSLR